MALLIAFCFFSGAATIGVAALNFPSDPQLQEDRLAAGLIAGMLGFIAVLLAVAAFRRRDYVSADGSIIPFIVMGQFLGSGRVDSSDGFDGSDGGSGDY